MSKNKIFENEFYTEYAFKIVEEIEPSIRNIFEKYKDEVGIRKLSHLLMLTLMDIETENMLDKKFSLENKRVYKYIFNNPIEINIGEKTYRKWLDFKEGHSYETTGSKLADEVKSAIKRKLDFNEDDLIELAYYEKVPDVEIPLSELEILISYNGGVSVDTPVYSLNKLTTHQIDELQKFIRGQFSDGWGEHFEQFPITTREDGEEIFVSFWYNSPEWDIKLKSYKKLNSGEKEN